MTKTRYIRRTAMDGVGTTHRRRRSAWQWLRNQPGCDYRMSLAVNDGMPGLRLPRI